MSTRVIRIDQDVAQALARIRAQDDGSFSDAIRLVLRRTELTAQLDTGGLTGAEMAELAWLRGVT